MTDQATRVVLAGWYQDPAQSGQVRWWNGLAWTEHVREKPSGSESLGDVPHPADLESELKREYGITTGENEIIASRGAAGTALVAQARPAQSSAVDRPTSRTSRPMSAAMAARSAKNRSSTGTSWLIALSPLLLLVVGIVAAYLYFYVVQTPLVFPIAFAVPFVLCILWAVRDSRTLASHGFKAPSALWALASALVYLIVRRVRVTGTGPLAMFLVIGALVVGIPPALAASGQLAPLSAALRIQQTIATDYVSHGKAILVNCPPFVDATTPGTLYTCDITQATGVHRTLFVSIDGGGKFSYSISL